MGEQVESPQQIPSTSATVLARSQREVGKGVPEEPPVRRPSSGGVLARPAAVLGGGHGPGGPLQVGAVRTRRQGLTPGQGRRPGERPRDRGPRGSLAEGSGGGSARPKVGGAGGRTQPPPLPRPQSGRHAGPSGSRWVWCHQARGRRKLLESGTGMAAREAGQGRAQMVPVEEAVGQLRAAPRPPAPITATQLAGCPRPRGAPPRASPGPPCIT